MPFCIRLFRINSYKIYHKVSLKFYFYVLMQYTAMAVFWYPQMFTYFRCSLSIAFSFKWFIILQLKFQITVKQYAGIVVTNAQHIENRNVPMTVVAHIFLFYFYLLKFILIIYVLPIRKVSDRRIRWPSYFLHIRR